MSRLSANSAAVIVAPVDPALTNAAEFPAATSAAAITTEAPSLPRTAATGSSSFVIDSLLAITSTPSGGSDNSAGGPKTRTAMPSAAAIPAPSSISPGPPSAPNPSSATGVATPYSCASWSAASCLAASFAASSSAVGKVITSRPA